jgi:hypothetical protein
MDLSKRHLTYILLLGALVLGFLAAAPAVAAVYVDGYVSASPDGNCVLVRDHEGKVYVLEGGGWQGVIGNDHVRLEGRFIPERRCGVRNGFEVSNVATVWSDDAHGQVYYSHERDGRFRDWAQSHRRDQWEKWDRERRQHHDRGGEHHEEHHEPPPPR